MGKGLESCVAGKEKRKPGAEQKVGGENWETVKVRKTPTTRYEREMTSTLLSWLQTTLFRQMWLIRWVFAVLTCLVIRGGVPDWQYEAEKKRDREPHGRKWVNCGPAAGFENGWWQVVSRQRPRVRRCLTGPNWENGCRCLLHFRSPDQGAQFVSCRSIPSFPASSLSSTS